ncbi:Exonuclease SbcC [Janthinobacterium sp. CG23_2]|nr:Exonuclease SbcC [Janthinobacterium sp. CG23_2]CUU32909.1 Exonuclease SbcC [Janthinobacterium sp. CG23_2]
MFQMFGFGGVACPRCEHQNAGDSGYCAKCGLTLGAPRNEPVFRENRWIPGADELAVFFGVEQLSGLFVKTLRVPATTRAYILQAGKATEVPQGEYEIEGFFTRLNHLLRNQHAEILITRTAAMPVEFSFDDLLTAEHLAIGARFTVSIKIEQVSAFAQHFMTMPGAVTSSHLRELLAPSVRQLAAEFIAGQSIRDMSGNRDLRPQLDERLQGSLKLRLAQYGLAVAQVDTLALRHDKFDAHQARIGTLWLVADEHHVKLEHAKQLDQLYNDEEWQRIRREEQENRLRYRRQELRQDDSIDKAELTLQNAERLQSLRAREIDLYGRIVDSKSRKQALERGAGDIVNELEHELAKKGAAREDESTEWAHLRHLAQLRMRTELEVAQQAALEMRQLAQQRFSHQLLQQQIQNKITQALGIEDESRKRAELARLHQAQQAASERETAMEAEQHKARWQSLALANAAHKREAERIAEWEDQLALDRKRDLLRADMLKDTGAKADAEEINQKIGTLRRGGAEQDAITQHEKLLRTIDADGRHARQSQQIELEAEERRHALRQQEQEAAWQQELKRLAHERETQFAQQAHEAELARIEISRVSTIGNLSDTGKVALAAGPNALALAEVMKTQVHAGMTPHQLAALASVVAATYSVTPAEAARGAQERVERERALRDAEVDKDRRHQLDLLGMQNDVNKAALASQSALGTGVAQGGAQVRYDQAPRPVVRMCPNGHRAGPNDKFCAECGAAIQP